MCGITGWVGPAGVDGTLDEVERATALLAHRGPDGQTVMTLPSADPEMEVIFGHRRLAIIDRSPAGDQPMPNEDSTIHCVFNGEIYNFIKLQRFLEQKGHVFRSRCDTEVIVHAYEELGDSFVERLEGMFAIGIWDSRRHRLLLARDRAGKKPLFYSWNRGCLAFASETKALRAMSGVDASIDWDALPDYLELGYVPAPRTLHAGIDQVPAGTSMIFDSAGVSTPHQYWDLEFPPRPGEISWADAVEGFRQRFDSAVHHRLIADVPLGALLSGGLDSSAVVAAMVQQSSRVQTFCLGFGDAPSFDERKYARQVAERFSTDHYEDVIRVEPDELLDDVVWHLDQPLADSSAIPTYLVSRAARRHVTVVLNGDGGDEVLGGYERFSAALLADRMPNAVVAGVRSAARMLPGTDGYHDLKSRVERFTQRPGDPIIDRYQSWLTIFTPDLLGQVFARKIERKPLQPISGSLLHQLLYLNFKTYLHDDLLVKMDRMSMAHSLEARSPFLDRELVEFVASLPPSMKATPLQRKRLLKGAMQGVLPQEIIRRRKHGFGAPVDAWFRSSLIAPFRDLVLGEGSRISERLDVATISRLMDEHQSGTRSHGSRLWAILVLETWLRSLEQTTSSPHPVRSQRLSAG